MDKSKIIHDLTIVLVSKLDNVTKPEEIVTAYNEFLPRVAKSYNEHNPMPKAKVISRHDFFGNSEV